MTLQQVLFILFGAITLGAALMVVTLRNVLHAALSLVLSFLGVGALCTLLDAPLLAAAELFLYIGGVAVPIVFAVVLTQGRMTTGAQGANRQWRAAAPAAMALCGVLVWVVLNHSGAAAPGPVRENSITELGRAALIPGRLVLPLGITLVYLLVALVGATATARER